MLPLVGYAKLAIEQALLQADDEWLFPRHIKSGHCYATHASNAVNKWLKKDFSGLTAHCLRHTFRDRLRDGVQLRVGRCNWGLFKWKVSRLKI